MFSLHLQSRNEDGGKIFYRQAVRHLADHTVSNLTVSLHSSVSIGIILRAGRLQVRLLSLCFTHAPVGTGDASGR